VSFTSGSEAYEVIRQAIVAATSLDDGLVVWQDAAQPFASDGVLIRLDALADRGVEWQPLEDLTDNDDEAVTLQRSLRQNREVSVACSVETISAGPSGAACDVAQLLVDGLDMYGAEDPETILFTGPKELLEAAGVVFIEAGSITPHSRLVDGRMLTVYSVDLLFRYLRQRDDTNLRTISTVRADVTPQVAAGTPLDTFELEIPL
jgi:hypothetical protein